MHIAPIRAKQEATLRLTERRKVARCSIAHAIERATARRRELSRSKLQQRCFAGARFSHDGDDLARIKNKRHVAASELFAVPFAQAVSDKERLITLGRGHDRLRGISTRKLKPWRSNPSES